MRSIRKQLLRWVLVPLFGISIGTATFAYGLTFELIRDVYDDELINSADSIVARIQYEHGALSINVPANVISMLGHDNKDAFYYSVYSNGKMVGGNHELPQLKLSSDFDFQTVLVQGEELRAVSMAVPKQESGPDNVVVVVAETRRARQDLVGKIFLVVMLPQLILILCGCVAIWLGVGRGLRELEEVRSAVASRSPLDLKPVSTDVPVEVAPLVDTLNRFLAGISEDLDRQKRFAANAAHQLRTPLAGLGTYCELAIRNAVSEKDKGLLSQMQQIIARMSNLVNQLLALARYETRVTVANNKRVFDLNAVVSAAAAELAPQAIQKSLELEFEPATLAPSMMGDQIGVHEMVKNLLDNAIKYTSIGGKINIGVRSDQKTATVFVDDNGVGIPDTELPRVFERFYRVPNTPESGTGLGLSIVKDVADAHGAEIRFSKGATGKGTRVTVSFPVSELPTGQPVQLQESSQKK